MTQGRLAAELTSDAVLYALAGSVAFLVFVLILDPKLVRSGIGLSLITLDVGLVLLYVPAVLHRYLGLQLSQVAFAWYYLATILIAGTAVWWRTFILIAAQRRAARKTNHPPPGEPGGG